MSSHLPERWDGSLVPRSIQQNRINRSINRYTDNASASTQKEVIDQVCHADATMHAIGMASMLIDMAQATVGDNPMKQQAAAALLASWVQTTVARNEKRWGGVKK